MKKIVLTGMSGSGKTTIGGLLAKMLNFHHADIDFIITEKEKSDIPYIFATKGEKYFRYLERQIINSLAGENLVISPGAGAFEDVKNRYVLFNNSAVIYLKTSPETIFERLKNTNDRPMLKNMTLERINELLNIRKDHYELADYTIVTDNKSPEEITEQILKWLN